MIQPMNDDERTCPATTEIDGVTVRCEGPIRHGGHHKWTDPTTGNVYDWRPPDPRRQ